MNTDAGQPETYTDADKVQHFRTAALASAKAEEQKIREEIAAYRKMFFEERTVSLDQELERYAKERRQELEKEAHFELSKLALEQKHERLAIEASYREELFSLVERKLKAFTESGDYAAFLAGLASRGALMLTGEVQVFYRPQDEACCPAVLEQLEKAGLRNARLRPDDSIVYGGLRFLETESGKTINETLDERLSRAKQTFSAAMFSSRSGSDRKA